MLTFIVQFSLLRFFVLDSVQFLVINSCSLLGFTCFKHFFENVNIAENRLKKVVNASLVSVIDCFVNYHTWLWFGTL
jgi:hypothetical protein